MNFNEVAFEFAAGRVDQLPESDMPEIVFSGHSNVGKSSLINKLVHIKTVANEHFTHTSVFLKFAIEVSISFLISSFPKPVCAENGISGTCSIVLKMSL